MAAYARYMAILSLILCMLALSAALANIFGMPTPLADNTVCFVAFGGLVLLTIPLILGQPKAETLPSDVRGRLHPSAFRRQLTGPFAHWSRPHRRYFRVFRNPGVTVTVALMFSGVLTGSLYESFFAGACLSVAMGMARYAAWLGDPVGIRLEHILGTQPRLRRNRRRDWRPTVPSLP